ncbi:MAG: NDP-sugar synthase [Chlorobium sp.]|nr:NDP-sugar synthase [Chlorobium sp.]MCW8815127.1 NDP-sugar synthase [Chlorobium sp.]MCW8819450.1 NDP-sugar synthase [Ignavibacteriaceae bacterium]
MKAFILAAGFGSRLMPITTFTPKPLIPVLNLPSICYTLAFLKEAGIEKVICNVHHHADIIRRFFSENNNFGMDLHISEETTILGTGGGLKRCENLLDDEPFILINSDIIADFDLKSCIDCHDKSSNAGSLMLYETPEAKTIGDVGINEDRIVDFRNMRKTGLRSNYIYAGAAVLNPSIFRYLSTGFSSIVDTGFTGLIEHESLGYFPHDGFWQDIGTMQTFWQANIPNREKILQIGKRISQQTGVAPHMLSSDVVIAQNATVEESIVGSNCRIEDGAIVRHSVLLPETVIAQGTVMERSIAFPGGMISVD